MRRVAIVVAGVLVAALAWWLWPRPEPVSSAVLPAEDVLPSPTPTMTRTGPTPHAEAHAPSHAELPPAPEPVDARVEALLADERVDAVCALSLPVPEAVGHLLVGEPTDPPPYNGRLVQVLNGRAYLPLLTEEYGGEGGSGWLTVPGYAPVHVTWDGVTDATRGTCGPEVVDLSPAVASVSGTVEHAEGMPEGTVFVEGCGNQTLVDDDGTYVLDVHTGGPCIVQAFRREGFWASASEPVELDPRPGEDLTADLALPDVERGGIGILVEEVEGGIAVTEVLSGGAGEDADLRSGDVIVSIDGEGLEDLELRDFVERAVGDAGTTLDLVVMRNGVEHSVQIERRAI